MSPALFAATKCLLNALYAGELKTAVCLQLLGRKDGEALRKFLQFDISLNIFGHFDMDRVLYYV